METIDSYARPGTRTVVRPPDPTAEFTRALAFLVEHSAKAVGGSAVRMARCASRTCEAADLLTCDGRRQVPVLQALAVHELLDEGLVTCEAVGESFGEYVLYLCCRLADDLSRPRQERKGRQLRFAELLCPDAAAIKMASLTSELRHVVRAPVTLAGPPGQDRELVQLAEQFGARLRGVSAALRERFDLALHAAQQHATASARRDASNDGMVQVAI